MMRDLVRHVLLLAVAAVLSWWVLLRSDAGVHSSPAARSAEPALLVALRPTVDEDLPQSPPAQSAPPPESAPRPEEAHPPEDDPSEPLPEPPAGGTTDDEPAAVEAPPPPERGVPEGDAGDGGEPEEAASADQAEPSEPVEAESPDRPEPNPGQAATDPAGTRAPPADLMRDPELLATAADELSGRSRQGFETVLLASPEEQLEIARFFGEELLLVPRAALDPALDRPTYFLLDTETERISPVREPLQLDRYRQYRDLFDYEYARLPAALRELRRSVLSRSEVYLFAALIPASEWAVVVGRRQEALAGTNRQLPEVRRFVLRYAGQSGGGYDLVVDEIVFTDGGRHRPADKQEGVRSP